MDELERLRLEERFYGAIHKLERELAFQKDFVAKRNKEIDVLQQEIEYRDIIINDLKIIAGTGTK